MSDFEKAKIIKNGNVMLENIVVDQPKKAIRSGEIKLGSLIMKVHVLNTGERVIDEQSLIEFIKWLENPEEFNASEVEQFWKDLNNF